MLENGSQDDWRGTFNRKSLQMFGTSQNSGNYLSYKPNKACICVSINRNVIYSMPLKSAVVLLQTDDKQLYFVSKYK